jgi:two-component system NarL family response regulator/two-component system response regulator DegU
MNKKSIIALDDEPLIAILMKEVVAEDPELEITQIATAKDEFLSLVTQKHFDAALIDISVGGREGGIELLHTLKEMGMNMPLIILSAHDEVHYALKCLQAGARAYISKRYICTDMINCLKRVLDGHLYVSGDRGEHLLKQYRTTTHAGIESS